MTATAAATSQASVPANAPRLLYLVSEDWYFLSHRLPMARAAQAAGFDVHVATRVDKGRAAIEAEGFTLHALTWRRGSTNPVDFAKAVAQVRRAYREVAPDLAHQVAFWPSIVGALAAAGLGVPRLSALAGMGFAFTSNAPKARLLRLLLLPLLRHLLSGPHATVLVQNPDDYRAMAALGIAPERIALIPGSGVDTERLVSLPEPGSPDHHGLCRPPARRQGPARADRRAGTADVTRRGRALVDRRRTRSGQPGFDPGG